MLALAATGVMTQTPDATRRTWLILDEVSALGKIGALEDFLTRARKSGGCAIVGLQSIAQLRERYGRNGAESMLSCLSSQLILNVSDPDTADYMSRVLGDVQVARRLRSAGQADHGANVHWSRTVQTERLILPSEITSLPQLCGFLRLTGGLPIAPVRLRVPLSMPEQDSPFRPRGLSPLPRLCADGTKTDERESPGDLPDFGEDEAGQ
jgi:type IV secretory pathway TraG/TraD family ATPase VirD4